jgi:hypothetical protein
MNKAYTTQVEAMIHVLCTNGVKQAEHLQEIIDMAHEAINPIDEQKAVIASSQLCGFIKACVDIAESDRESRFFDETYGKDLPAFLRRQAD